MISISKKSGIINTLSTMFIQRQTAERTVLPEFNIGTNCQKVSYQVRRWPAELKQRIKHMKQVVAEKKAHEINCDGFDRADARDVERVCIKLLWRVVITLHILLAAQAFAAHERAVTTTSKGANSQ